MSLIENLADESVKLGRIYYETLQEKIVSTFPGNGSITEAMAFSGAVRQIAATASATFIVQAAVGKDQKKALIDTDVEHFRELLELMVYGVKN